MAGSFGALVHTNLKTWIGGRGFVLVVLAAFIPLVLSVAWVGTHRADVAPTSLTWSPQAPELGQPVNFTATIKNTGHFAVGAFNASIVVGPTDIVDGKKQIGIRGQNSTRIPGLEPGQTATVTMKWTPSFNPFGQIDAGTYEVLVDADSNDEIGEIDEYNNRIEQNIQIHIGDLPAAQVKQLLPSNALQNDKNGTKVDVAVRNVTWTPPEVFPNATLQLHAEVVNLGNASVGGVLATLRVAQGQGSTSLNETTFNGTLAPGAVQPLDVAWKVPAQQDPHRPELFRVEAYARVLHGNDTNPNNNLVSKGAVLDRKIIFPEKPERATIRGYYISIVRQLLLPLLLPIIGLYYAAGVLSDERDRGNLVYLLTRPLDRAALPVARFLVSFTVAGAALAIGILGSFLLILGLHQSELSYLVAPFLLVLVALFAYGSVFTLIGVSVSRPYLAGMGFVGWEWIVQVGRDIVLNGRPVVAPWMQNLSVFKWLEELSKNWSVDHLDYLPKTHPAQTALEVLLVGAVVVLGAAMYVARRREFED